MLALTFLFILGTGCKDKGGKGDLMATVDGRKIYREEVDKYYRTQTAGSAQQPSGEQATNLRLLRPCQHYAGRRRETSCERAAALS